MRATTTRSRAGRRLAVAAGDLRGRGPDRRWSSRPGRCPRRGMARGAGGRLQEGVCAAGEDRAVHRPGRPARSSRPTAATLHTGDRRRARARPQRPAHEERRLPGRGDHQPRDRGPDHTCPGPSRGRRRRGAALADRAEAVQRPRERAARLLSDQPLQHVQRLLRHPVGRGPSRWLAGATTPTFTAASIGAGAPLYFKPTELGRYLLYSRSKTLPRRRPARRGYAADPARPTTGSRRCRRGPVPVPDPRQGLPDRHRLQGHGHEHRDARSGCACAVVAPTSPRSAPTSPATRSPE